MQLPLLLLLAAPWLAPQGRVDAEVRVVPAAVAAGSQAVLQLDLAIEEGWHLYHPDQDPAAPGVTVGVEVAGEGVRVVGPLTTGAEPVVHEEKLGSERLTFLWLSGRPRFTLPLEVVGPPGRRTLEVRLRWQACDENSCLAPVRRTVEVPLEVLPGAGTQEPAWVESDLADGRVAWQALLEPPEPAAGGTATLRLRARIQEGWHLYHPDQDSSLGIAPQAVALPEGLEAAAEGLESLQEATPHVERVGKERLTYLWLAGEPEFLLPVRVTAAPGLLTGEVRVRWQSCDERRCNLPQVTAIPLQATVQPMAPGAAGGGATTVGRPDLLSGGFWAFILAAVAAALFSLATPCVFPMIPITVSFFTKRAEKGQGTALGNALAYGGGIVLTFVGLGLGVTALFGAGGINALASDPWLNVALGLLFLVFGISLIGFFEIRPPAWLQNRVSQADARSRQRSGYGPVVVMAVAFSITAFTCTVAFVGAILALAAQSGEWLWALLGMTVYGVVFASPFFLLALFPTAVRRLPRAGGWMNSLKVTLGFIEIAAAWKFLSNADRVWNLQLLTRKVVVILTAVPFLLLGAYHLGLIAVPHERELFGRIRPGLRRRLTGGLFLLFSAYLFTGLVAERPYRGILEAYFPPRNYGVPELGPADLFWHESFEEAFAAAREEDRLLFLDFTGVTCANCLLMEGNVFPDPRVRPLLEQFVRAELYVDRPPHGAENMRLEIERFGTSQQPLYVVLDPRQDEEEWPGRVVATFPGYHPDAAKFAAFLRRALDSRLDAALPR